MKKYNLISNIKYIFKESVSIVKPMKLWLFLYFISSLLVPILETLIATVVVYALTNNYSILDYTLFLVIIITLTIIFQIIKVYSFERENWESTFVRCNQFWVRLSKRSMTCDYERIEPKSGQKELSNAFEALDSNWIGVEGMMKEVPTTIINIAGMLVYAVLVIIYSPIIVIILLIMSIFDFIMGGRANKVLEKNREKMNDSYYEKEYLLKDVADPVNGKDIRIYKMQAWFDNLFIALTKKRFKFTKKIRQNSLIINISDTVFLAIRDVIAYTTLIVKVIDGTIDVATFTFLLGIVSGFTVWLTAFSESFYNLRMDSKQVECYRKFLDKKDHFNHSKGRNIEDLNLPLTIEFKNVSFTYPDTDVEIIHNLNLEIKAGEKIALVGNNGAGKTTIIKLLCGLYQPTEGEILLNGYNINEFNIDEYMKLLSVVFQDTLPLAFSIFNNVTCEPIEKANTDKFWNSVEKAGLKEKILSLEKKEETFITQAFDEKGIRLSGGETQKLMLARALYKNAPLLILDEPTAALDPINEEKMYLTYKTFSQGNTSIFISHRLSSTKFCDRILFLENGQIIEEGTHESLINQNTKYRYMFDVQAQYYKEGEHNEE